MMGSARDVLSSVLSYYTAWLVFDSRHGKKIISGIYRISLSSQDNARPASLLIGYWLLVAYTCRSKPALNYRCHMPVREYTNKCITSMHKEIHTSLRSHQYKNKYSL